MKHKRLVLLILSLFTVVTITACGATKDQSSNSSIKSVETTSAVAAKADANAGASIKGPAVPMSKEKKQGNKIAIVYFSDPEVENVSSVQGNTEYIAQIIQNKTKGDVFRIEPQTAYPVNHAALVPIAKKELLQDARPEIKPMDTDFRQYDTVFIGYPIWWSDLPMSVYTFLERQNLAGKQIILFSTHGGSGLANTVESIMDKETNAKVNTNAFTVSRDDVTKAEPAVLSWLKSLGYN